MSAATKQQALVKLHGMANKIGYPDKWRDYSKLEIIRGDELGNVERSRKFEFNRELAKIGKPVDRGEWDMTPPTVNAYYNPQMNDINFPAGVLQPPAFDPTSDAAPNYGDTGGTIGHELTHGFDDEGRQFDAQGNLRDWWTEEDGKEFVKRASCISDQYSTYTIIDDIKINGKLTLGEDVADLGGLILAYMAWKEDTKGQNAATDRRPHAGSEILRRLRPKLVRRVPRRNQAPARHRRSSLSGKISYQRSSLQHAGIPGSVPLQSRIAHGESESLPRVVRRN